MTLQKHSAALMKGGKILRLRNSLPGVHAEQSVLKWCEKDGPTPQS